MTLVVLGVGTGAAHACLEPRISVDSSTIERATPGDSVPFVLTGLDDGATYTVTLNGQVVVPDGKQTGRESVTRGSFVMPDFGPRARTLELNFEATHDGGQWGDPAPPQIQYSPVPALQAPAADQQAQPQPAPAVQSPIEQATAQQSDPQPSPQTPQTPQSGGPGIGGGPGPGNGPNDRPGGPREPGGGDAATDLESAKRRAAVPSRAADRFARSAVLAIGAPLSSRAAAAEVPAPHSTEAHQAADVRITPPGIDIRQPAEPRAGAAAGAGDFPLGTLIALAALTLGGVALAMTLRGRAAGAQAARVAQPDQPLPPLPAVVDQAIEAELQEMLAEHAAAEHSPARERDGPVRVGS